MTINVALFGTGRIAEFGYIPAIKQINDVEIISVLSRDAQRGRQFAKKHNITKSFSNIDELLTDKNLHAVIICSPDAAHEEQAIKACQANKHILCEKPMSTDVESCMRMIKQIDNAKIVFGMGYNNRFNAGLRYIKDTITSKKIGKIYYARAALSTQQNDPEGWRAIGEQSKFWAMSATGTHMLDIFRWLFGEPIDARSITLSPKHRSVNDEITSILLNFSDNLICEITASAILPKLNRIEVYSDNDFIIGENVFGIKTDEVIYYNDKKVRIKPINSFFGEVVDFTNAIIKKRAPRASYIDGLENVKIMNGILNK
tara:strand:+ start:855 stop:1799 length:945 start_codon:yes stop_codon:yes gene_type:complete